MGTVLSPSGKCNNITMKACVHRPVINKTTAIYELQPESSRAIVDVIAVNTSDEEGTVTMYVTAEAIPQPETAIEYQKNLESGESLIRRGLILTVDEVLYFRSGNGGISVRITSIEEH